MPTKHHFPDSPSDSESTSTHKTSDELSQLPVKQQSTIKLLILGALLWISISHLATVFLSSYVNQIDFTIIGNYVEPLLGSSPFALLSSILPDDVITFDTEQGTHSRPSSLIHPKVEIDESKGISLVAEYNDLVLSHYPQEASQGRVPCMLPVENDIPSSIHQVPPFPFGNHLKFAMVADMDKNSRDPDHLLWHSYIKTGTLNRDKDDGKLTISWDKMERISTNLAANNRSIELSEIVWFNEKFLTVCDYTGVVYTIRPIAGDIFPRFILADGDGRSARTFKSEWMTVYNDQLFIGSHGKEWILNGVIQARGAEWVKVIDTAGKVTSIDWGERYQLLRKATNSTLPGYLTHEAVLWHEPAKKWIFLPRKHSVDIPFDDLVDETQGTNLLIIVDEHFENINVLRVGPLEPEWGFASLARIPGTSLMLATKIREMGDETTTKVTIFDLEGNVLIDPPFIDAGDLKFEGVEFVGEYESL